MRTRRKILKKLKKNSAIKEARELDYNKDGSVQIAVGLKEASDFFHPYSYLTYEIMNPVVKDYIESFESTIPIENNVSIDIYTETQTTQEEKKRIRRTVKRHYAEEIVSIERPFKKETSKAILFVIIGFLILFAEAILYHYFSNMYIDTILAVIGWMFLWDGLEVLLYERANTKLQLIRYYRLLNAKVHVRNYSLKIKREYGIEDEDDDDDDDDYDDIIKVGKQNNKNISTKTNN